MKRVKVNVKVKNSKAQELMEKSRRQVKFESNSNLNSIKDQTVTNNYYTVQNLQDITQEEFSKSFMRDARRYSYSLEVQL